MKAVPVVLYAVLQLCIVVTAVAQEFRYHRSTLPRLGMSPLQGSRTVKSKTSCAVKCGMLSQECYSFAYNSGSRLCTLGTKVSLYRPTISPDQGKLYIREGCESIEGFAIEKTSKFNLCVFRSTPYREDFACALKACEAMDSHMVTIKSLDKWNYLTRIVQKDSDGFFWIGMDDRATEGSWVWSYDKSPVTNFQYQSMKKNMFRSDQPDNDGNQDCIRMSLVPLLFDIECDKPARYLCEKPNLS